jgi:transcriptional regulator with XRE-family HTH domain
MPTLPSEPRDATADQILGRLRALIEKVGGGSASGDQRKAAGAAFRALRDALGLSRNDLASRMDVSPQTVHRWQRGDALPRSEHLATLAVVVGELRERASIPEIHGRRLGIRGLREILEREAQARAVLLLKAQVEFLSATHGPTRAKMEDIIRERVARDVPVRYYFVHPSGDNAASRSFKEFQRRLAPDLAGAVSEVEVPPTLRLQLGMSELEASWIVLLYDPEGQRIYRRDLDAFLECPVADYLDEQGMELSPGQGDSIWVELPQRHAESLRTALEDIPKLKDVVEPRPDATGGKQ